MNQNGNAPQQADIFTFSLIAVLAVIVIYGGYDFYSRRHDKKTDVVEASEVAVPAPVIVRSAEPVKPAVEAQAETAQASTALTDEEIQLKFSQGLRDINQCLGLNVEAPADLVAPTTDNFLEALKPEMGEQVLQTDDSSTVDLTTPAGEKRRLKVDMDYSGADRIVRRVKYFQVGDTGNLSAINLDAEQSADPSETFLASLEEDGQVTSREKTQRIYFGGGEEVVLSEKDGLISDFIMNRNGKTFHCRPLDPSQESCDCQ